MWLKMAKSEYDIQAENFLNKNGIRIIKKLLDQKPPQWNTSSGMHNRYKITVTRKGTPGNKFSFTFWDSINNTEKGLEPTDYDILATISSDSNQYSDFKEFCGEMGYSDDSINALRTWKAYKRQSNKINKFFTPGEIEELQEIR
jgi:hypothetical protein